MNYYEHHLGDYIESTAHLSMLEDGAYGRLLRKYYATERPLPTDLQDVYRLVLCRGAAERKAVERVLREFFELQTDGWHQERCDKEIAKFHERTAKQKAISMMGVEARRSHNRQSTVSQPTVNGGLTPPDSNPQSPSTNPHTPSGGVGGVDKPDWMKTTTEMVLEEQARARR